MIENITIKNFRAISHLKIDFTPFTILIGENSCGKSTVLQALDFLCSLAVRDIDEYLKDRHWEFNDIKSQFSKGRDPIEFLVRYKASQKTILWKISIDESYGKWIIEEDFTDAKTGVSYLSSKGHNDMLFDFSRLDLKSSILNALDMDYADNQIDSSIASLKKTLLSSSSFELLSPDKMRSRGSRGKVENIGMGGEKLAAYIHNFNSTKKNELSRMVSDFIGYEVKISTTTKGTPGWVNLYLEEIWPDSPLKIEKYYLSDGLLRIIAFSAILVSKDSKKGSSDLENRGSKGLILLDEIEDGINPGLAEKLIREFGELAESFGYQVVVTSHSPVMVNYVNEDDIQYLWRDKKGALRAEKLFGSSEMQETLDILNPGEVWLNYSKEEIISKLMSSSGGAYA